MNLAKLIEHLDVQHVEGSPDKEIRSICYDSRRAVPDSLFVALRGGRTDGHRFIEQAVEGGATAVVLEEPHPAGKATTLLVPDTRAALSRIAAAFYKAPSRRLKVTGVTGTNGKTTVTFLAKHICESVFLRCGLIGTVRYEVGERVLPAVHTTPEALDVQELLAGMRDAGCKAAVMEVSSHALAQGRVEEVEFDAVVFTNLTQDHLDYHGNMESYFAAKARLFSAPSPRSRKRPAAVINIDDSYGSKLAEKTRAIMPVVTYGMNARADFRASNPRQTFQGTTFQLEAKGRSFLVRTPLIGRFNVYNALAALGAASVLGIDVRAGVAALADAPQVPGRLEQLAGKRAFQVFVDYAHTPDALLNVMKTLRELNPERLLVVFGCGGNRDRGKRLLMGQAVDAHADYSIITTDNPRDEDPDAIINDIRRGFSGTAFEVIPDRREAIFKSIAMARPRDIVLIAGKGHENYQEIAGHRIPFDDAETAARALEQRRNA